jgi:hypothetical protein
VHLGDPLGIGNVSRSNPHSRIVARGGSCAEQADHVAVGVGEQCQPPLVGQGDQVQSLGAAEFLGPPERGVHVVDVEVHDYSGVRAVRAGLPDPAHRLVAGAVDQRVRLVENVDPPVALLTEDVTWSMPPSTEWYSGVDAVMDFAVRVPLTSCGSWRHVPISANAQPAVAFYLRHEDGQAHLRWSITVLTLRDDRIAGLTSFLGAQHFDLFGLPVSLP